LKPKIASAGVTFTSLQICYDRRNDVRKKFVFSFLSYKYWVWHSADRN